MLTLRIPKIPPASTPTPDEAPAAERPTERAPTLSTPKFGRQLTTLSFSWINGRCEAVAVQRGELTGSWESPEAGDSLEAFPNLLKAAVAATGYKGNAVSLVLAHPRLTQQFVETPPVKGHALGAVVERQVRKLKVFDGEPAWAFQPTLPTKTAHGVLVHLFPRALLDLLIQGAKTAGLHLVSVTPPTSILLQQLSRFPIKTDDVALLAADTSGMTTLVVARGDGQLLLSRSLDGSRTTAGASLAVDIGRTVLFVTQQFDATVKGVWLFGENAISRLSELQSQVQVAVQLSPESSRPRYWAEEAAQIPLGQAPNLVTTEQRQAPQRRILFRATCLVTACLVVAAIVAAALSALLVRREQSAIGDLQRRITQLTDQHKTLQRSHLELTRKQRMTDLIAQDRPTPVPVWFLAYLAEALPQQLVLTNLHLRREGTLWQVRLAGVPQGLSTNSSVAAGELAQQVAQLTQNLTQGPFPLHILAPDYPQTSPPAPAEAGRQTFAAMAGWAAKLTPTPAPASTLTSASASTHFLVEGLLP